MKKLLKAILPVPVLNLLRFIRIRLRFLLHLPLKKAHDLIQFEVHLAEHCNLNCCGCDHFSPLAEPEFVNIDIFKRDMERLGNLFSHKCKWIHLLGGEPLLNPDIISLMKIARENFSEGSIQIVTNGVLLPKMSDEFWQACHDYNIEVSMTNYPLNIDMDKVSAMTEKFDVLFSYYYAKKDDKKNFMYKAPLDLSGSGDISRNFAHCGRGNNCIFLRDGKLYPCTMIPNVHIFNKKFGKNIPVTEKDYVNIYQDITPDEIFSRLARPVPACAYCDIKGIRGGIKWHVSKREISEWV